MMSFDEFIKALLELGSDLSKWGNKNIFGGVKGMPITHQIGFGRYWRLERIDPNTIDIRWLNSDTHKRMAISGIGIGGGLTVLSKCDHWLFKIIGAGATIYGSVKLYELYLDWKAGFEAAEQLDYAYWNRVPYTSVTR